MSTSIFVAACLVSALALGGCSGGPPSTATSSGAAVPSLGRPSAVTSAAATASAPAASPSIPPSASPSPTGFSSTTYGYSLTLPEGWSAIQATKVWDGRGSPASDVAEADRFDGPLSVSAWFFGAPTRKDVAGRVHEFIAAHAAAHGDTCPPVPEMQDQIEIGDQPAVLLGWNCGILINLAVTVHNGSAYVFGFRDPVVAAASDQADRDVFLALLKSVRFPN